MLDFDHARRMMVDCQIRTFDVTDLGIIAAFDKVPREKFVAQGLKDFAYMDQPILAGTLTNGEDRFLLTPMVLARMIQALDIKSGDRVLDVACGLGFASEILHELGADVIALEQDKTVALQAQSLLGKHVQVVAGPLPQGFADNAPYDAILINGKIETAPDLLLSQLASGGRLVCIEGQNQASKARLYVKTTSSVGSRDLFDANAPLLHAFHREKSFSF